MARGNLPSELMIAFSCPQRPVKVEEFVEFWESLTVEQRDYYRHCDVYA